MLSIPKLLPGNCILQSLRIQAQKSKTCLFPLSFRHTFWAIFNCILWMLFQNTLDSIFGNEFVLSPFISSKNSFKKCIIQRKCSFDEERFVRFKGKIKQYIPFNQVANNTNFAFKKYEEFSSNQLF